MFYDGYTMTTNTSQSFFYALGMMSGTALDGIDLALIKTDGLTHVERMGFKTYAYAPAFQDTLKAAMLYDPRQETDIWRALEQELTQLHIKAAKDFLHNQPQVDIIGFHGQTIYHNPKQGITSQMGDGKLMADVLGIDVINQFRINDVKHGGEGAPLVPIYHQALFKNYTKPIAIINIGGVANITYIDDTHLIAFDVGPGNALINDWVAQHLGLPYDAEGKHAAQGICNKAVLESYLAHSFFQEPPPKSLDRNQFDVAACAQLTLVDGACTLSEFTIAAITQANEWLPQQPAMYYICGGGVHNTYLMNGLKAKLPAPVHNLLVLGINPDAIEAEAFAYLAVRSLKGLPLTFPTTTGVNQPVSGGVLYPWKLKSDKEISVR